MKLETVEKMRELASVDAKIESLKEQRKALDADHAANVANIKNQIEDLGKTRETVLDVIHADESVAKDLRRSRGPRKTKTEEKTEGEVKAAKKRGAKTDAP